MGKPTDKAGRFRRLERKIRQWRKAAAVWCRLKLEGGIFPPESRGGNTSAGGGKTVLFIEAQVVTPDQDAGSRSMMCYLEFFRQAGWTVKFLADDFAARQPYTRRLQEMGVEMLVGDYFLLKWKSWLRQNGPALDCVFISRSHVAKKWAGPVRSFTRAPILFYGQDLFSRTLTRASKELGDASFLKPVRDHEQDEHAAIGAADFIFYPSEEEVRWLAARYPAKRIARLPLYVFTPPQKDEAGWAGRKDILFVGGFAHRPNEDAVLWFVEKAWPEILRAWPEMVFHVAGSQPTGKILALASDRIHVHGHLPEEELTALHRRCRLAVAPLRYGGGIKGKILQAMHLGTPVVTTPIGAEGLHWSRPTMQTCELKDFAAGVTALYGDEPRWLELRRNARDFLGAEYSRAALRAALSPALGSLVAAPHI